MRTLNTRIKNKAATPAVGKQARKPTKAIKQWCRQNPATARLVEVPKEINHGALAAAFSLPVAVQSKTPSDSPRVCDPNEIAKDWVLLRLGKDDDDGNLWASREGLLYLWHNDQGYHLPRVVSTAEAQRWIAEHGLDNWCEPYFPEDSPAHELVNVPREAKESSGGVAAGGSSLFLQMENSVNCTVALLRMFARERTDEIEQGTRADMQAEATGCEQLARDCTKELVRVWNAAHHESVALHRGEVKTMGKASVELQLTVAKAVGLLKILGDELESPDAVGRSGHVCLAHDCISRLRADYGAAFDECLALEKAHEQRAA